MADASLVVSFDAAGLVMGDLTAQVPGLAVRQYVQVNGAIDDLQVVFEVIHGGGLLPRIQEEFAQRYDAVFQVLFDNPAHWKAIATIGDAEPLHAHPVYGPALEAASHCQRAVIVFEDGMSIHRYDFKADTSPSVRQEMADLLRRSCEEHGLPCMVRFADPETPIEEWRPLTDPRNHPDS